MMTTMVLLLFFPFGSALAMFLHIFGKSAQNIVVIVSNERQTTGNIVSWQRTAHRHSCQGHLFGKKHRTSLGTFELNLGYSWVGGDSPMRISLIVAPPCGSDSSQAPVQRSLILTPNKYRMLTLTFCNFLNVVDDDDDGAVVNFFVLDPP